jgi:hypothetical protein
MADCVLKSGDRCIWKRMRAGHLCNLVLVEENGTFVMRRVDYDLCDENNCRVLDIKVQISRRRGRSRSAQRSQYRRNVIPKL